MDHDEFARRAEALRARLYRTAYLYLGSEADALEAVDEGVYQALRALRQLREPAFFETWLTRIVLNECHRELRRRKRLAGEETLPDTAGPDAYDALPLKEAVRRLPEELRAVVILRYFAGYTQAETAQALNIPQGTAATRQRRALALLRLELGEEGDASPETRNIRPCSRSWSPRPRPWRARRRGPCAAGGGTAACGASASRRGAWRPALSPLCCW